MSWPGAYDRAAELTYKIGQAAQRRQLQSALRTAKEELTIVKASVRKAAGARPSSGSGGVDKPKAVSDEVVDFGGTQFQVEALSFVELCEALPSLFRAVGGELGRTYQLPPQSVQSLVQVCKHHVVQRRGWV